MKKTLLTILTALAPVLALHADEGMWLPALIQQRIIDMQHKGFRLEAEDIYSINQASLKDAVVLFDGGCTGELISPDGLLLTNHHCGYDRIQEHSSVEHDYLRDGFWAMTREQELPNKGIFVRFLDRMEDVTAAVLKGYDPSMTEDERAALVAENSKSISLQASDPEQGLKAIVEGLYYGNQYFLFVYREFTDVRLVGAPPSAIGKFGGDTDNWMWPRHTGDFSMFRIYADRDNNPAAYSPDNVPYHPKKYFKISLQGFNEGDFTFIYGYPGSTREYIHSAGVRYVEEVSDPHKINLRTIRLDIQKKYMDASQDVRIRYSAKNASVANAWKKWQGESKGLRKLKTVSRKQQFESEFEKWAEGSEYEGITRRLDSLYALLGPYSFATDYYNESVRAVEIARFAERIMNALSEPDRVRELSEDFFKDYYGPIDRECFAALMEQYDRNVPEEFKPEYFTSNMSRYGSAAAWADALYSATLFTDRERVASLREEDREAAAADPAAEFAREFSEWFSSEVLPRYIALNRELQLANRDYMRGQMEYAKAVTGTTDNFYPDANLTLRVAYGHVQGYYPSDGIYYYPYSTMKGIMEKDNPEIFDYNIPQRLRDLYASKDYGRWTDSTGEVPVCFIATNHTTGGNSGSPVINAEGNLIGINFDRVWEGTMSDLDFDPDFCRNISLDIRYVMFTIDKVAGAGHLLDEMTFVE